MESKAKVALPGRAKEKGRVVLEDNQLVIFTKYRWAKLVFGLLVEYLVSDKERSRINLWDIVRVELGENWAGWPIYTLMLNNGDIYKIYFDSHNELTDTLKQHMQKRLLLR